jgi:heme/copper-type cytochrome/quinol oxidase subunit 2
MYQTKPNHPVLLTIKSAIAPKSLIDSQTEVYRNTYLNFINNKITINSNDPIYLKSQYKMMRKNISNMIRIQADKAVAMPVDTRIQLLTLSKDIIHS